MHPASSSSGISMPLAGPDVLVVMCIGGGVTQGRDSLTKFPLVEED